MSDLLKKRAFSMLKKADTQLIKLLNEIQLLNLIRDEGPISRIELSRRTEMSKVAVFDIINRLIDAGFVVDIGKGQSTSKGGKKPSLVKLNPGNHFVIGIELKRTEVRIAVADIEATIMDKTRMAFEVGENPEKVIKKIFRKIDNLLHKNGIAEEKLVSIGIGIPGLVNYQDERLRFADTLKDWDKISIGQYFEKRYKVPAIIENDVNTITIGESILGAAKEYADIVTIWIGEGLGSGIIIRNQLFQGLSGGAGEIGYLEIDSYCNPRQLHYLFNGQKYFGDVLANRNLKESLLPHIKAPQNRPKEDLTLRQMIKIAEYTSGECQEVLKEYTSLLEILIMNVVKVLNPQVIVLSGKIFDYSKYIYKTLKQCVEDSTTHLPYLSAHIVKGKLRDEAGLRGAIAMALEIIFEAKMSNHSISGFK
ncbi:MAG: ROK family protein [Caldithrix sp.]|nr:ROK family protein [Caldithrix sp.]